MYRLCSSHLVPNSPEPRALACAVLGYNRYTINENALASGGKGVLVGVLIELVIKEALLFFLASKAHQ